MFEQDFVSFGKHRQGSIMSRTTADSPGPTMVREKTVLQGRGAMSTNLPSNVNYVNSTTAQQPTSSVPAPVKCKALFIGINYYGTQYQLNGCVFDAYNVRSFLKQYMSFPSAPNQSDQVFDTLIMTDEESSKGTMRYPTARNIRNAMQWLVADNDAQTRLFLHYSGHGGFRKNYDGREIDGYDETIYPVDYQITGPIADDELNSILIKHLHPEARLTALFDSCHSGTVLDLQYFYDVTLMPRDMKPCAVESKQHLNKALQHYFGNRVPRSPVSPTNFMYQHGQRGQQRQPSARVFQGRPGVIMFSGCRDDQVSMDACDSSGCFGAMSSMWVSTLRKNPNISYRNLILMIFNELQTRRLSDQVPCISSSAPLNVDQLFSLI